MIVDERRATTSPTAPGPGVGVGGLRRSAKLPHFPALDGLRGLAVVAVVLFHAQIEWMVGGFLGVSTFFTLSGFLITSLLLSERHATGTIDLRAFWVRRFRRLMPASLVCLALVAAFGALAGEAVQRRNLAGDGLAALGYVANWRFLLSEAAYADIFGQASPLAHFWSLAIEEQFYLVFPLLAWVLLAKARVSRSTFFAVLVALAGGSLALGLAVPMSADAIYYNTGTRAIELLVGALLAVLVFDRRVTQALGRNRSVQLPLALLGLAALAASAALWVLTEHADKASPWLYRGGFAAYSLLTALVIAAAILPIGPVRHLLAFPPLRWLGLISYGVYLYHWPIFLWLDPTRTGLEGWSLFGVRIAVTLAAAVVSYVLVESPVRHRKGLARRIPVWRLAPPVIAALCVALVYVTLGAPEPEIDFAAAEQKLAAATEESGPPPPPPDSRLDKPARPRMAFFGDSTALVTAMGMSNWENSTKRAQPVDGSPRLGCGIGRGGERRNERGGVDDVADTCSRWELDFEQAIENEQPDIAVVQIGPWEVADRRLEDDPARKWRSFGDPLYDDFMLREMLLAVDKLSANGALVVWLTSPPIGPGKSGDMARSKGNAGDPARMARLNELIAQLPQLRPGKVELVDLAGWVEGTGEDRRLRPDGVHFSDATAVEVSEKFLGNAILGTYDRWWEATAEQRKADKAKGDLDEATTAGSDDAAEKYVTKKYKVLVAGGAEAEVVAQGMQAWAGRTNGLQIETAVNPDCGVIASHARRIGGREQLTPAACENAVFGILQKVAAVRPDVVLIVPTKWDLAELRLTPDGPFVSWREPAMQTFAFQQFAATIKAVNKGRSVVQWATVAVGDPRAGSDRSAAKQLPTAPVEIASGYNEALEQTLFGRPVGIQKVDFGKFADRALDVVAETKDLTPAEHGVLGDWFAKQVYIQYDNGDKLRTS